MVVEPGLIATGAPTKFPGFQVYVAAPLANKLVPGPGVQTDGFAAEGEIVGVAFTVIKIFACPVHVADEPLTV